MGFFDFLSKKTSNEGNYRVKVKDIMTTDPIVVSGTTSISQVEEIFAQNQIWSIYVGDHDNYIGIITRDDLKNRTKNKNKSALAFSIMSKGVFSIDANADVEEAKTFLYKKKINGLAVIRNGKHCGIITRYDIKNKPIILPDEHTEIDSPSNAPNPLSEPPPENADLIWTNADIELLRQSWNDGKSIQNIANLLKRSPDAVLHKLIGTGLVGYNDDNCDPKPARFGFTWSDKEREQLISEINAGKSIPEIASIHQRNLNAILHTMVKSDIIDYNDRSVLEKLIPNPVSSDNNQLIRTLISELKNNGNIELRNAAASQLSSFHEPSVVNALIDCVKYDPQARYRALVSLRTIGDPVAIPVFIHHLKDPSQRIRLVSVNALGEIGDFSVIKHLESLIKSNDYQQTFKYGGNQEIILAAKEAIQKIHIKEGRVSPIDETSHKVNRQVTDARVLNHEGFELAKMKEFEDAIVFFEKALLIDNNYLDALNNHGWASSQLGRYEEAILYYEKAKKIDSDNIRAWRALGWNLACMHQYDEAITHIDKAISLDNASGRSWRYKGEILSSKGDFRGAITCFEKALNLDPTDKKTRENLIEVTKKLVPSDDIIITRAYEFYAGYIRVKISVNNPTSFVINDVKFEPDLDPAILSLDRHEPEQYPQENGKIILGTINPNNNRTVSLYLEPLICAKEGTDVHCHIRYKDAQGKPGSLDMEPLRVQVVCPIFETKETMKMNIGTLKQLLEFLPSKDSKVFSVPRNLDASIQLKIFQNVIQLHDIQHINTLRRANNFESWYYGRTKINQKDIVIKLGIEKDKDSVEITAYGYDLKDLTGLLAEFNRHINEELHKIDQTKKKFSLKVGDTIMQSQNLLELCDVLGNCSADVAIEIGDMINVGKKMGNTKMNNQVQCPQCQNLMNIEDKYCMICGCNLINKP